MKAEKMILLPLDGSEASLAALLPAKSLAALTDMAIHILYISDEKLTRDELLNKLGLKKENLGRFIITHKNGVPADIILQESESAYYIVMATHGQSCDMSKIAGKVSSSVIENSDKPVLLVRPDIKLHIKDNIWCPKNILIPLNGTPGAAQALSPAVDMLSKIDIKIDLLHISTARTKRPTEAGTLTAPYYTDHPQYEWPSWSGEFLRRFGGLLEHNHVKIRLYLSKGDPADEIIAFARKNDSHLIAMAWHGKLGPLHADILKKVIYQSPCPILLIKIALNK